uniref:Pseudouridine synthase n=1 Tax=Panagrolaimus sp. JU765 TaxID=591449 RepID=A0AC34RLE7_9BILA
MSSLIDGVLMIDKSAGICFYRCIVATKEKGYSRTNWEDYNYENPPKPECDF